MADIEFRTEGFDRAMLGVRGINEELRREIHEAVSEALATAETIMRATVPKRSGALASTIRASEPVFRPGGAGGGGFWEGELEIGEGVDYLPLVTEGTGEHGPGLREPIRAGRGPEFERPKASQWPPRKGSRWMVFRSRGHWWFLKSVRGQRPQTDFIDRPREVANEIIRQRVAAIDAGGVRTGRRG